MVRYLDREGRDESIKAVQTCITIANSYGVMQLRSFNMQGLRGDWKTLESSDRNTLIMERDRGLRTCMMEPYLQFDIR